MELQKHIPYPHVSVSSTLAETLPNVMFSQLLISEDTQLSVEWNNECGNSVTAMNVETQSLLVDYSLDFLDVETLCNYPVLNHILFILSSI